MSEGHGDGGQGDAEHGDSHENHGQEGHDTGHGGHGDYTSPDPYNVSALERIDVSAPDGQAYINARTIESTTSENDGYTDEGFSENELFDLERKSKRGERLDYTAHEISKLEALARKGVNKQHLKDPSLASQLETLLETIGLVGKNVMDITLGNYIVKKHNAKIMAGLTEGDEVVVLVHGWNQTPGAFLSQVGQLESEGYKVVALTYDNSQLFTAGAKEIDTQIKRIVSKTNTPILYIGHSDGGVVGMAAAMKYGTDRYMQRMVLSQTDINGGRTTLLPQYLVGGLPKKSNLAYQEGRENILSVNAHRPLDTEVYTIAGNAFFGGRNKSDGLLRVVDSHYQHADRRHIVDGAGHFHGAGGSKWYNDVTNNIALNGSWGKLNHHNNKHGKSVFKADHMYDIAHGRSANISNPGWYGGH